MSKGDERRGGRRGPLIGSFTRRGLWAEAQVPVTLEHVLLEAARNADFRAQLLDDTERAIAARGLRLAASEAAMLATLQRSTIEQMIAQLDAREARDNRFTRAVATAALVGGMLVASCDFEDPPMLGATGADLDEDADVDTDSDTDTDTDGDTDTDADTGSDSEMDGGADGGPDAGDAG